MPLTLEEVRRQGLEALRDRLGRAGMIRFLQQFETGRGDYSQSRWEWVDQTSLEDIRASRQSRARKKPRKRSRHS